MTDKHQNRVIYTVTAAVCVVALATLVLAGMLVIRELQPTAQITPAPIATPELANDPRY